MAVTQKDIAKHLKISQSLVAGVLANDPKTRASEETRRRIQDAARELRYQPSRSARALVTGKYRQIAFPYLDLGAATGTTGITGDPAEGIILAAARHQFTTLILPFEGAYTSIYDIDTLLHSHGCDGICLPASGGSNELYEYLKQQNVPFVVVGNPGCDNVAWVDTDNYRYAYDSVAWLASQGHRRIGFVDFIDIQPYTKVLHQGYREAMQALCGGFYPELALHELLMEPGRMKDFLTQNERPSALIARDAYGALYWRTVALECGFRVPEDVAIVVHTPQVVRLLLPPDLICHEHEPHRVGMLAADLLIDWIENGAVPAQGPTLVPPLHPRLCGRQWDHSL